MGSSGVKWVKMVDLIYYNIFNEEKFNIIW